MSLRVFILHGSFRPSRFAGTGEILLLDPDGEERAGVFGAADGGLGVEAEHRGRVQRVEPVGEGFLELPVVKRRSAGGTAAAGPITTDQVVLAAGMHCRHRYFGPSLAMTGNSSPCSRVHGYLLICPGPRRFLSGLLPKPTLTWQHFLVSAPGRIRTRDPLLRRQLLCPAELRAPEGNCARRRSRDGHVRVAVCRVCQAALPRPGTSRRPEVTSRVPERTRTWRQP